jgi:hypothetical protein
MSLNSDPATKKAMSKYSFDFTIDGAAHRAWYDPEKDDLFFDCGSDCEESLGQFMIHLGQLIKLYAAESDIDELELQKFAWKHLKADIKVKKVLDKIE